MARLLRKIITVDRASLGRAYSTGVGDRRQRAKRATMDTSRCVPNVCVRRGEARQKDRGL